jgi:3-oxoacyl-[acyl-carrier protein] reductase
MLSGKIAVVTGASGGIGRAIAIAFAREGAAVAVHYNGNRAKAEAVRDLIAQEGGTAELFQGNVADFADCERMFDEIVERFGRIDILVNNAGITRDGLLMNMSEESFDEVLATNLKGCFHGIRFASRRMLKQRYGRILNVSSVSGVAGNAGQANYAASKAGVIGLTKSAARELAPDPLPSMPLHRDL